MFNLKKKKLAPLPSYLSIIHHNLSKNGFQQKRPELGIFLKKLKRTTFHSLKKVKCNLNFHIPMLMRYQVIKLIQWVYPPTLFQETGNRVQVSMSMLYWKSAEVIVSE